MEEEEEVATPDPVEAADISVEGGGPSKMIMNGVAHTT